MIKNLVWTMLLIMTGLPQFAFGFDGMTRALLAARSHCAELSPDWTPQYSSIKGYWHLAGKIGDASTGTVSLPAAIGNNGSELGGTGGPRTYVRGPIGHGITFDTAGSTRVEIPYSAGTSPTAALTVSGWVNFGNLADATTRRIFHNYDGGGGWGLDTSAGNLRFYVTSDGAARAVSYATSNLSDGQWYHIAANYDGTTVKLFVNGALVGSTVYVGTISYAANRAFCIAGETSPGGCNGGGYFTGSVDDVAIWNVGLSDADILTIYNRRTCID